MRFSSLVVLGFIALLSTMITATPDPADAVPAKNEADDTTNLVHNSRNSVAALSDTFNREMLSFNGNFNHRELNAFEDAICADSVIGGKFETVCEHCMIGEDYQSYNCKDTCEECFEEEGDEKYCHVLETEHSEEASDIYDRSIEQFHLYYSEGSRDPYKKVSYQLITTTTTDTFYFHYFLIDD